MAQPFRINHKKWPIKPIQQPFQLPDAAMLRCDVSDKAQPTTNPKTLNYNFPAENIHDPRAINHKAPRFTTRQSPQNS